jgi:DNA-binding transcriptional ArsR family regulator
MPPDDGAIALKTGADALIDLLRQRGELSLKEAALALSQPEGVVEWWAAFLEEDGLLKIRYKFTTPYYAIAEPLSKPGQAAKKASPAPPVQPAAEEAKALPAADLLAAAEAALKAGDLEKARELYLQVKQTYEILPSELEARAGQLLQGLTSVGAHYFQAGQARITELLKTVNDSIKQGKIATARQAYEQAKRHFETLPVQPAIERAKLEGELLTYAEQLATREYESLLRQASLAAKDVESLLSQAANALQKQDTKAALDLYQKAVTAKDRIPAGFLPKKAELDARVLHLNETLTEMTLRKSSTDFDTKASDLQQQLLQAEQLVKAGKLEDALMPFERSRALFAQLPEGFLERRSRFHAQLLQLSKALIGARFAKAQADFAAKKQVIEGLFIEADKALKDGNPSRAQLAYERILPLVNSLPIDFAEEALQLRLRLIALYRKLTT